MPRISIITPVFNGAGFLNEAIGSVLEQTYQDWQLIIVNDGSTDNTAEILKKLVDPRIQIIHQCNSGTSVARNSGLDLAVGKYITFLDADDRIPPNSLECRIEFLEANAEIDILNGSIRKFNETGEVGVYRPFLKKCQLFPRIAQLDQGVFFGPFYMVRKSAIGDYRFPEGISHCEDLIFFTELSHERNLIYGGISEWTYSYRLHSGSAMSNLPGIEAGYFEYLRRVLPMKKMSPYMRCYLRAKIRSILGKSWLRRGRPIQAVKSMISIMRV